MVNLCPCCGKNKDKNKGCINCGNSIKNIQRVTDYSNAFYNIGLKKSIDNEISSAIIDLKKSLLWNKYNIQVYNLLGLLYYRVGNIGEALKQWIVASSLDKEDEMSKGYIEQIQRNPKSLERYKESIDLYNASLKYLENDNIDVAIIRLKKAVHINADLVDARILLGICYIKNNKYKKARSQLINAIKLDSSNERALKYLYIINDKISSNDTSSEVIEDKKEQKTHKSLNQPSSRSLFRNSILYFVFGVAIMLGAEMFLIEPTQEEFYKNEINILTSKNDEQKREIEQLKKESTDRIAQLEKDRINLEKQSIENEQLINQYKLADKLQTARNYVQQYEYVLAASTIYGIDKLMLSESQKQEYEDTKESCYIKAAEKLYTEGLSYYNNEDYSNAKICFEKVIVYDKDSWMVKKSMYYLAEIEYSSGNLDQANNYYKKVIEKFPGTEEARLSASKIKQSN